MEEAVIQGVLANTTLLRDVLQEADDVGLIAIYADLYPSRVEEGVVLNEEQFLRWIAGEVI